MKDARNDLAPYGQVLARLQQETQTFCCCAQAVRWALKNDPGRSRQGQKSGIYKHLHVHTVYVQHVQLRHHISSRPPRFVQSVDGDDTGIPW